MLMPLVQHKLLHTKYIYTKHPLQHDCTIAENDNQKLDLVYVMSNMSFTWVFIREKKLYIVLLTTHYLYKVG